MLVATTGAEAGVGVLVGLTVSLAVWAVVSGRFRRWNVSAPMWFVAIGYLLANAASLVEVHLASEGLLMLAELTLAVVLFGDAARVSVHKLRSDAGLPVRLLLIGLPITIAFGTVVAHLLFPSLSWWVCAVIGASVAPTDAALGAAIIDDERVPDRIRRLINVESGLNDGIATPFVKFFLVAAVAGTIYETESDAAALRELGLGVVCGIAIGLLAAWIFARTKASGWSDRAERPVGVLAVALLSYAGTVGLDGNGFVAAFLAGLAFGGASRRLAHEAQPEAHALEFTHDVAELLSLVVWFMFGAVMVPVLSDVRWQDVAFALLALTVVRMLPVALVLMGTRLDRVTVAVIGWFGPRGLASVVFALLALGGLAPDDGNHVVRIITATVLLSVVLHGATAAPISRRYGATHPTV